MVDLMVPRCTDTVTVREMDRDELSGLVTTVHSKFTDRPRDEVGDVVRSAYRHLARNATVTAHLIPLTLNRSIRLMRIAQNQGCGSEPGELLVRGDCPTRKTG